MKSVSAVYAPAIQWQGSSEFAGTPHVKVLREDRTTGSKTLLVRLAPAGTIDPPTHAGTVQHYVLKGEYESQGVVYQEGTLRVVPKGSKASPITTTTGVTFLVVCDPTTDAV